jgi:hypothetical protein
MLSFNRDDGRWYVLTPSFGAVKAIPVINDDEIGFVANVVVPVGDAGAGIIN